MTEKIKIIFISHNFHFLNNIIDNLNKDKYEVTIHEIKLSTNELLNPSLRIKYTSELLEIIGENQIVWVEWLLTQACLLSQVRNKTFKLICRLHSYEYFYKKNIYILSTNFQNIDKLVVVNDWFKYKLIQNFNVPKSIIINLPNQFNIFFNENTPKRQKNLGVVGINSLTNKGIDKILDIFEKIHQTDNEYTLHIKGKYNIVTAEDILEARKASKLLERSRMDPIENPSDKDYLYFKLQEQKRLEKEKEEEAAVLRSLTANTNDANSDNSPKLNNEVKK
jgi:glycosyltransferase involved in cell wall biosynthesis